MAKRTVALDELPDALRIKSRNDFIISVVQSWSRGEGLQGEGIAVDIAKAQIDEFVAQFGGFQRLHFGGDGNGGNVRPFVHGDRAS